MSYKNSSCVNPDCSEGVREDDEFCAHCGTKQFERHFITKIIRFKNHIQTSKDSTKPDKPRTPKASPIPIVSESPETMLSKGWAKPSQKLTVRIKDKLQKTRKIKTPDSMSMLSDIAPYNKPPKPKPVSSVTIEKGD